MTNVRHDGLTIDPANDLHSVRGEWERLAAETDNVFATWEWAAAWHTHLGETAELALAVARRGDGKAAAILPLCIVRRRPMRVIRFVGAGPSDELGPVCAPPDRAQATDALRRHAERTLGDAGLFLAERLWADHQLGPGLGCELLQTTSSPVLPICGRSFDEFLASRSRNFRDQVRRRERRLLREHHLVYRLTQDPGELEADMRTLIRLHAARWSEQDSTALRDERASFHFEFASRALERGWLRLWTMELDGNAVAAWYGFRFGGVEFYYQAGRDPAFESLNVGFVLLCHTIRCAFEDGMREYRLGRGDEAYKRRFAERDSGLETFASAAGIRGRLALLAVKAVLRSSPQLRARAWRLGTGTRRPT